MKDSPVTAAITRAINDFEDWTHQAAFVGCAHPDERDEIEDGFEKSKARLKATIGRALAKARRHD